MRILKRDGMEWVEVDQVIRGWMKEESTFCSALELIEEIRYDFGQWNLFIKCGETHDR